MKVVVGFLEVVSNKGKKRVAKLGAKGKPADFKELLLLEPDSGSTNACKRWHRWLGQDNRCLVAFTALFGARCDR